MKKRIITLLLIIALVSALLAGCAKSGNKEPPASETRTVTPATDTPSEESTPEDAARIEEPDDDDSKNEDTTTLRPSPVPANPSVSGDNATPKPTASPNEKPTVSPNEKPTASPVTSPDVTPATNLYVEPPTLVSASYIGSGADAKFSLSVIIPASAFEFQGSYHGSGEAILEASYRDVGGAWIDWDEQKVNLWHIDQTTQALSFLYPAANMIPRTEFCVRLTYRYVDDNGEHFASSVWSKSANTMPDAPEPEGSEAFVGQWHSMNMLAAGWDERYAFHADGTYIYAASQIKLSGNTIYTFGTWSVYEGALAMFPERILSLEGARIVHDDNLGDYYEGGKNVLIVFEISERSLCQIERGGIDPESGRATIKINGHTWYNFDEHDEYNSFFSGYDHFMGSYEERTEAGW